MRPRPFAAFACAVALWIAGAPPGAVASPTAPPSPVAATASGAIYVSTLPAGADIWLDDGYVGRAPLYLDALTLGRHHVTVVKAGWQTQESNVTVSSASTPSIATFALVHSVAGGTGRMLLHGANPSAVTIDGGTVTPDHNGYISLPSGRHEVSAKFSHGRVTRMFMVYPDTTTDLVLRDVEPQTPATRSSVVAPAGDYLPDIAYHLDHGKIAVQYGGHDVVGRVGVATFRVDGRPVEYDAAPFVMNDKLYLPLALLVRLTESDRR